MKKRKELLDRRKEFIKLAKHAEKKGMLQRAVFLWKEVVKIGDQLLKKYTHLIDK